MRSIRRATRRSTWTLALALVTAASAGAGALAYPSPDAVQPLAVGAAVPSAVVLTVEGDPVDLREVVRERGALLVFYRGGW
jgi:hypothetical protein